MMALSKCVLDRVSERKNELKGRMYGLVEIMSRSVFARMQKRTSLDKDLLDQLVEQVFNKFTQELNDARRDGCAHGRDKWNMHLDFGESYEDHPEMNNLDSIEPLSSPFDSNEDSSLHSSPTLSQPSSQSQHQNFIQNDEHSSDSELMTESVPISSTLSKTSPQKAFQGFKIYEEFDEGEYNDDICEEMMDIDQNEKQSEELDRDDQTTGNVSNYSEINGQIDSDMSEDVQHENDEKLELNDKVDDEQVKNLDGTEVQKHQIAQSMTSGMSQASSQHLVREWSWNELEKCWELMENGQIDDDEGNDEVGEECDDDESEVEVIDKDYQDVGNDEGLLKDDEDFDGELNGLVHVKIPDEPSTEVQKHQLTGSIPSGVSQSTLQHLVSECRIDDAKDKVDVEIEANESSMKSWSWNEVEKCWELMKNCQIDVVVGNDEVGEECDDNESEVEDMDEDDQNVGNDEKLIMDYQMEDEDSEDRVDQLKGLRANIEVADAKGDQRPDSMNTKQQPLASLDRNIEHTNQTVLTNSIESVPSPSHRHNTIPVFAKKSYLNEHQVTQLKNDEVGEYYGYRDDQHGDDKLKGSNIDGTEAKEGQFSIIVPSRQVVTDKRPTGKHICEHCDKEFQYLSNFTIHTRTHTGEKPYKCPFDNCNKTFSQKTHMEMHHKSHTRQYSHVCAHCSKSFRSPYELKIHNRSHTGERPFKCPVENCNKTFADRKTIKMHHISHTGHFPHVCAHCPIRFRSLSELTIHTRIHTGEKPYKCPFDNCNMTFSRKGNMKTHHMTHTGQFPHICDLCSKSFRTLSELKIHTQIHNGERPFKCNWKDCGMDFTSKYRLEKHYRTYGSTI